MNTKEQTPAFRIAVSGVMMALYIAVVYATQSFSFGAYQIRIATSLYAMGYLFPFLVIPMGLANFLSNTLFGGLGLPDMIGGLLVGLATTFTVAQIRRHSLPVWLCALPILVFPGLCVPIWLSYLLQLPYPALALSLCIGQTVPAVCGVLLIKVLGRRIRAAAAVHDPLPAFRKP